MRRLLARVAAATRAIYEDTPEARRDSALAAYLLAGPVALGVAVAGGALERPWVFGTALALLSVQIVALLRRRTIEAADWIVLGTAIDASFALGAAAMSHHEETLVWLIVVPVAWAAVFHSTGVVVLTTATHSLTATGATLFLGHSDGLVVLLAPAFAFVLVSLSGHGLAGALRRSRAEVARLAASVEECLYVGVGPPGAADVTLLGGDDSAGRLFGGVVPPARVRDTWLAGIHPGDRALYDAARAEMYAGRAFDLEYRLVGVDGRERWIWDRASCVHRADGSVQVNGVASDITDRRRVREELVDALARAEAAALELTRAASHDTLTGLATRQRLETALSAAIAAVGAGGPPPALIVADVDHFKRINDSFGHSVGDEVLVQVAERLRAAAGPLDLVARMGGEEFVVLTRGPVEDLREAAERLRAGIAGDPFLTTVGPLALTASVGASRHAPGVAPDALFREADLAMYAAKRRGRDRALLTSDLRADDLVAEEPEPVRLARAMAAASPAADGHAERVAELAAAVAARLGLSAVGVLRARLAGLVHEVGRRALDRVDGLGDAAAVVGAQALPLSADAPLEARILAAADAYASRENGPDPLAEVRRLAGTTLDPSVVEALAEVVGAGADGERRAA